MEAVSIPPAAERNSRLCIVDAGCYPEIGMQVKWFLSRARYKIRAARGNGGDGGSGGSCTTEFTE